MKMKRLLAILLTLVMLMSLFPTSAFADPESGEPAQETTPVAKVGDVEYTDFDKALAAWGAGKTLTLLADVVTSKTFTVEVNATKSTNNWILQLGDNTWTANNCDAIKLYAAGGTVMDQNYGLKIYANENGGIVADKKNVIKCEYDVSTAGYRPRLEIHGGTYTGSVIVNYASLTYNNTSISNGPSTWFYAGDDGEAPVFNGNMYLAKCPIYVYSGEFNGSTFNTYPVSSTANTCLYGGKFKTLPSNSNSKVTTYGSGIVVYYTTDSYYECKASTNPYEAKVSASSVVSKLTSNNGYSNGYVYFEDASYAISNYSSVILNAGVTAGANKSLSSGTFTLDATAEGASYTGTVTLTGTGAKFVIKGQTANVVSSRSGYYVSLSETDGTYTYSLINNWAAEIGGVKYGNLVAAAVAYPDGFTGGTFTADPTNNLAEGYMAVKTSDTQWTVKKVTEVVTPSDSVTVEQTQQISHVDTTEIASVITEEETKTAIVTQTKVEGLELTGKPEISVGEQEMTGVQAVVAAATQAAEANSDFAKVLASTDTEAVTMTEIKVKVDVEVKPTDYTAPATQQDTKSGSVTFSLEPVATVTVTTKDADDKVIATGEQKNVPVTNEMLDQTKDITVSIYTGFKPAQIVHTDDKGNIIQVFNGEEEIDYNEKTGVASVKINHFSVLTVTEQAYVAQIVDTKYETLAAAIAAVPENGETATEIILLAETSEQLTIPANKNIVLNLNGKQITASESYAVRVEGVLTVNDSAATVGGISGTDYAIDVAPSGNLTFINGTTNGIKVLGDTSISKYVAGYGKAGTATISGGVHTKEGLAVSGQATMSVTGGKFEKITTSTITDANSKTLKTTGFVTNAYSKNKTSHWGKGNVYDPIPVDDYEVIELSASSTGEDLAAFNEGYLYRVRAIPVVPVAKIGDKEYMTLDAAISEVTDGQTIQVISNIKSKTGFTINKTGMAFTIDLGNNKIEITKDEPWAFTLNAGTVTIQNGSIESDYAIQNLGGTLNLINLSVDCDNGIYSNSDSAVTAINKCSINGGWGFCGIDVIKGTMTIVDGEYDVNGITVNEKNGASLVISGAPRFGNLVVLDYNWIADGYLIQMVGECGVDEHEDEGWTVFWTWRTSYLERTTVKYAKATVNGVETEFIELQEAIDKADEGSTVTVLNNVDLGYTIQINKSITLDLNGKQVTSKAAVWVEGEDVDATIKNGTIRNNILISYWNTSDGINAGEGAKVTLENVKLYPDGYAAIQAGDYFQDGIGFVEIKGADSLINTNGGQVAGRFSVSDAGNSYLKITGGTFDADPTAYVPYGYTVVDNKNGTWTVNPLPKVARIDETEYYSLADAIAADLAASKLEGYTGSTITMIADETIIGNAGVTVKAGQNIILDLNGKTVSNYLTESKTSQVITNKGTLTITDGSKAGTGKITNNYADTITGDWPTYNYQTNLITNIGTLTINGGSYNNTADSGICYCIDNVTNGNLQTPVLTIADGTFEAAGNAAVRMFCNSTTNLNSVTINGGTFTAHYYGITVHNANANNNKGSLTINGGRFIATDDEEGYNLSAVCYKSPSNAISITVTNGEFDDNVAFNSPIVITGGLYATKTYTDPDTEIEYKLSDYVAPGYEVVDNNHATYKFKVQPKMQVPVEGGGSIGVDVEGDSKPAAAEANQNISDDKKDAAGTVATAVGGNGSDKIVDLKSDAIQIVENLTMSKIETLAKNNNKGTELTNALNNAKQGEQNNMDVNIKTDVTTRTKVVVDDVVVVAATEGQSSKITSFDLDIKPVYTVIVTTTVTDPDTGKVESTTVVKVVEDADLEVTEPKTVTFKAPENFQWEAGSIIVIKHTKDNGDVFYYDATYNTTTREISFVNPNGFSNFKTIVTAHPAEGKVAAVIKANETVTYYDTLTAAFTAAATGDTVRLLDDEVLVESEITVSKDKDITLDLNGRKLTLSEDEHDGAFYVNGTLTVKDSAAGGVLDAQYANTVFGGNKQVNISGGTILGILRTNNLTVTGGSFDNEPAASCIASGYEAVKVGDMWIVQAKQPVAIILDQNNAQVGNSYLDLQAALTAATAGQTVKLLRNADLGEKFVQVYNKTSAITLDLDGKTLKSSGSVVLKVISSELNLVNGTISNTSADETILPHGVELDTNAVLNVDENVSIRIATTEGLYYAIGGNLAAAAGKVVLASDNGTYDGSINVNYAEISGGNFTEDVTVTNDATISGGTFAKKVTVTDVATITGGTFKSTVSFGAGSTISNGEGTVPTFDGTVTTPDASVSGGKFKIRTAEAKLASDKCYTTNAAEDYYAVVNAVASSGNGGYKKFQSFADAANHRDTTAVTLLATPAEDDVITLDPSEQETIKVDLNGKLVDVKTIVLAPAGYEVVVAADGTCSLKLLAPTIKYGENDVTNGKVFETYSGAEFVFTASSEATGETYAWTKVDDDTFSAATAFIELKNVAESGTYSVTVSENGYTSDPVTVEVTIATKSLSDAMINVEDVVYNGQEQKTASVSDKLNGVEIIAASDYVIVYSEDVMNVGTVTVTVSANGGNYSGTIGGSYKITSRPVTVTVGNASKIWGNADPTTFTGTVEEQDDTNKRGLVSGDNLGVSYTRETGETVGEYAITASITNTNYALTVVSGTFTIATAFARIDSKYYDSLDEAFADAKNGDTITVLNDCQFGNIDLTSKTLILDLNGKTITGKPGASANSQICLDGNVDLTVKDGSESKTGKAIGNPLVFSICESKNIFTLQGGTIEGAGGHTGPVVLFGASESVVNISGGTLKTTSNNSFGLAIFQSSNNTLNVSGGTIEGSNAAIGGNFGGSGNRITVTNATIKAPVAFSLADTNTEVTVSGGTFEGTTTLVKTGTNCINNTVKITGGTYPETMTTYAEVGENNALEISGGTFRNAVPLEYCDPAFHPVKNANGTYGVEDGAAVACIDGVYYTKDTVQGAFDSVTAASDITMLGGCNVELEDKVFYFVNGTETGAQLNALKELGVVVINDAGKATFTYQAKASIGEDGTTAKNAVYGDMNKIIDAANVDDGVNTGKLYVALGGHNRLWFDLYKDWTLDTDKKINSYDGAGSWIYTHGNVTIDLHGETLTQDPGAAGTGANNGWAALEVYDGTLTVKDSGTGGKVLGAKRALDIGEDASAVLKSGTLSTLAIPYYAGNAYGTVVALQNNGSSFTMDGGTLTYEFLENETLPDYSAKAPIQSFNSSANATVTVNGGTVKELPADLRIDGAATSGLVAGEIEPTVAATVEVVKQVAKIGNNYYTTLADAVTAAQAGETVTLLENVTLTEAQTISKAITLDGNGKKITYNGTPDTTNPINNNVFNVISAGGKVTIKDLTIDGNGTAYNAINVYQTETELNNVKISKCGGYGVVANGSNVTVTGANTDINGNGLLWKTQAEGAGISSYTADINVDKGAVVTVNAGTVGSLYGEGGSATVTDTAKVTNVAANGTSEITISGGEVTNAYTAGTGKLAISAGKVDIVGKNNNEGTIAISGGSFGMKVPLDYCADGFRPAEQGTDGRYTVNSGAAVAKIGDVYYASFAEAVAVANVANKTSTIQLIANDTVTTDVLVNTSAKITVNLNGKTLTFGDNGDLFVAGGNEVNFVGTMAEGEGIVLTGTGVDHHGEGVPMPSKMFNAAGGKMTFDKVAITTNEIGSNVDKIIFSYGDTTFTDSKITLNSIHNHALYQENGTMTLNNTDIDAKTVKKGRIFQGDGVSDGAIIINNSKIEVGTNISGNVGITLDNSEVIMTNVTAESCCRDSKLTMKNGSKYTVNGTDWHGFESILVMDSTSEVSVTGTSKSEGHEGALIGLYLKGGSVIPSGAKVKVENFDQRGTNRGSIQLFTGVDTSVTIAEGAIVSCDGELLISGNADVKAGTYASTRIDKFSSLVTDPGAITINLDKGSFGNVVDNKGTDLNISGGTYTSVKVADGVDSSKVDISGGTFDVKPDESLFAAGYAPKYNEETNKWGVDDCVAYITRGKETYNYDTLDGAVAAATVSGDVVTLLANTTSNGFEVKSGVTVNFNNHSVTPTASFAGITNNGTIVVYTENDAIIDTLLMIPGTYKAGEEISHEFTSKIGSAKIPANSTIEASIKPGKNETANGAAQKLEVTVPNGTALEWDSVPPKMELVVNGDLKLSGSVYRSTADAMAAVPANNTTVTVYGKLTLNGDITVGAGDATTYAASNISAPAGLPTIKAEELVKGNKIIVNASDLDGESYTVVDLPNGTRTLADFGTVTVNGAYEAMVNETGDLVIKQAVAKIGSKYYANFKDAVAALKSGDTLVLLQNCSMADCKDGFANKGNVTITANGNAKLTLCDGLRSATNTSLTFRNMTINAHDDSNTNNWYNGWSGAISETYDGCTINGQITTYAGKSTFKDCIFNQQQKDYSIFTYNTYLTVEGCTFNVQTKAIKGYSEGNGPTGKIYLAVSDCDFYFAQNTDKHAVEINSDYVSIVGATDALCTVTGPEGSNIGLIGGDKSKENENENSYFIINATFDENGKIMSGTQAPVIITKDGVDTEIYKPVPEILKEMAINSESVNASDNGILKIEKIENAVASITKTVTVITSSENPKTVESTVTVYYLTLADAIAAAEANDTVTLLKDCSADAIAITKNLTLDLNGHTVTKTPITGEIGAAKQSAFTVKKDSTLTINGAATTGEGAHGAGTVIGGIVVGTASDDNAGLVINGGTYQGISNDKYGYAAIQTNGGNTNDRVEIKNATVTGDDVAVYAAGGGTYTVTNSTITGATGIAIKAGDLTVTGSTIKGTGAYVSTSPNNNGVEADGSAIYIESNDGYKGDISITFVGNDNKVESTNAYAINESVKTGSSEKLVSLTIPGGTFKGASDKAAVKVSDTAKDVPAISGGTFSSEVPLEYCADGFIPKDLGDGKYGVDNALVDVIKTKADFLAFAKQVKDNPASYDNHLVKLDADIDLTGVAMQPIDKFGGTFDGQNHTITGLTINTSRSDVGLFGLASNGKKVTIQNLTLDGASVTSTGERVGALVGNGSGSTVLNCTVKNSTVTAAGQAGGVIGQLGSGRIDGCTAENNTVTVTNNVAGEGRVGGLIGKVNVDSEYTVTNNTVTGGTVKGLDSAALIGQIINGATAANWKIADNTMTGVKVLDAAGEAAYVAIGNPRNADTITNIISNPNQISRNHWTDPDKTYVDGYVDGVPEYWTIAVGEKSVSVENFWERVEDTVTGKPYNSVNDALAAGATSLKMLMNSKEAKGIDIGTTVTLDLNGKTISPATSGYAEDYVIDVLHGGDLTVKDSSTGGKIDAGNVMCGIKMTKKDGDNSKAAKLTVLSGTIEGKLYGISGNGNAGRDNTVITISGGTVKATANAKVGSDVPTGIYQPQKGTLTISGGKVEGLNGVYVKCGSATISGNAVIKGNGTVSPEYGVNGNGASVSGYAFVVDNYGTSYPGGAPETISITGGKFDGPVASFAKTGETAKTNFISGGDFKGAPANDLFEEGKAPVGKTDATGWYKVGTAVAKIGDAQYATVKEAVDAAKDNDEIVLLADCTAGTAITVNDNVTIDLNGMTLKLDADTTVAAGKTVTIENSTSTTGGVDCQKNIVVNGTLDISDLAYGNGGLLMNRPGSLAIKSTGTVQMMSGWKDHSANALKAYTEHFFKGSETGAQVEYKGETGKHWTLGSDGVWAINNEVARTTVTKSDKTFTESFATLDAAITAADSGATVNVLKNTTLASNKVIDKTLTLDLGGKTVKPADNFSTNLNNRFGIITVNGGDLTVKNGTIDSNNIGKTVIGVVGAAEDKSSVYSKLTVDTDAKIVDAQDEGWGIYLLNSNYGGDGNAYDAQIDIKGEVDGCVFVVGTVHGGDSVININGKVDKGVYLNGFATVNVEEGAVISSTTYWDNGSGVEVRAGNLNVKGGTISSSGDPASVDPNQSGSTTVGCAVAISQHGTKLPINVNITGGTLNGVYAFREVNPQNNGNTDLDKIEINITGGSFDGMVESVYTKNFITGGEFHGEPAHDLFVEGKAPVGKTDAEGWFVVGNAVAKIGNAQYATLTEAVEAAKTGDVKKVVLVAGSAEDITLPAGVTFDTNSQNYTGTVTAPEGYFVKNASGVYTVELIGDNVAWNTKTGTTYDTLTKALAAASSGDTVELLADIEDEPFIVVESDITLDLAGHSITGAKFIYVTGSMIDSAALNARGIISASGYMFDPDTQKYTPVYDAEADGYKLFNLKFSDGNTKFDKEKDKLVFTLGPSDGERNAAYELLTANENYNARFKVVITFNWETDEETIEQSFNYKQEFIDQVMESNGRTVFSAAITGLTGTATAQPKYVICDAAGNAMYTLTGYTFTTTDGGTTWTRN